MNRQTYFNLLALLGLLIAFLPVWADEEDRIIIVEDNDGHPQSGTTNTPPPIYFPDCFKPDSTGTLEFNDEFFIYLSNTVYEEIRFIFRVEDNAGNLLNINHPGGTGNPYTLQFDLTGSGTPLVPYTYSYHPPAGYLLSFTLPWSVGLPPNYPTDDQIVFKYIVKGKVLNGPVEVIYTNGLITSDICVGGNINNGGGGGRFADKSTREMEFLTVSPNPFTSSLSLHKQHEAGTIRLSLWSSDGRFLGNKMMGEGQMNQSWDTSQLSPGCYFLRIEDGLHPPKTKKLVKVD